LARFTNKWTYFALLWTVVIFCFSSQPGKSQSIQPLLHDRFTGSELQKDLPDITISYGRITYSPHANPFQWVEFLFRKSAHLFEYGLLAALWSLSLRRRLPAWPILFSVLITVAFTASADEWNQSFVAGRTSLVSDVWIDVLGGLLGFLSLKAITMLHYVLTSYILYHRMSTEK
jgi:VanZ family protein